MKLYSLQYFSAQPNGASYELHDVVDNTLHPQHELVMRDIASVTQATLNEFTDNSNIRRTVSECRNKDLEKRINFIEHALNDSIVRLKRERLIADNSNKKTSPYDAKEFEGIYVDDNNLVSITDFDTNNHGFTLHDRVFQLCPSLPQFNSSYWLSELIRQESLRNKLVFRVRLDPLVNVSVDNYRPMFYKMWVHGKKLDWDRIRSLKYDEFGQWLNGDSMSTKSIEATDYVWQPSKGEVHFTCEELPTDNSNPMRGSRYFHAIFDTATGKVIHCDGALRFYSNSELEHRKKYHVRQGEVRKVGKRIKIFQIDEPISQQLFMNLATSFLVWNEDAVDYFN